MPDPKLSQRASQNSFDRLQLLVSTANAVVYHADARALLTEIFDLLSSYCQLEVCFSYWVTGARLQLAYCTGVPQEIQIGITWLDYGQAVCGTVAQTRRRMTAENIQASDEPLTELVRSLGIQAYACHPLMARERLIGTLSYGTRKRQSFNEEELAIMRAVSDQVAVAIDRLQMLDDLKQRNQQLTRAHASLKQFAYAASHDLQEPIRTMALCSQMLQREDYSNLSPEARNSLLMVMDSGARMHHLISRLLDYTETLSRVSGETPFTDANDALRDAQKVLGDAIAESNGRIEVETLPLVAVERQALARIFQNLLSNSIKYRREGVAPRVCITSHLEGKFVTIHVADNGPGIPTEYHDRIFDLFKRLHGSRLPGAGLGLATCKAIVEQYAGRMSVTSKAGQGATFSFTLPVAGPPR